MDNNVLGFALSYFFDNANHEWRCKVIAATKDGIFDVKYDMHNEPYIDYVVNGVHSSVYCSSDLISKLLFQSEEMLVRWQI